MQPSTTQCPKDQLESQQAKSCMEPSHCSSCSLTKAGLEAAEIARSVTNADPGNRQFVEAIAQAHNKAQAYVQECKTAYEKRLRGDVRNTLRHVKDFQAGDIVRHGMSDSALKTMGRKKSKLHPVNSKRICMVVQQTLIYTKNHL